MRRTVGFILLGLAGFLVTAAILALVWVPGQVKKTPLDVVTDTRLTGSAAALPTGGGGPVKYLSRTVADGAASSSDVVVFDNFTCLVSDPDGTAPDCVDDTDPDKRLVSAGTDRFATDRVTALAVNDEKYVGVNAVPHEGLVNKFPFDVEQKTYPFWDGIVDRAVETTFQGEEEIDGLAVYKFSYSVADEPAEISEGISGLYSMNKTMWIDKGTGSIIDESDKQVRKLDDGTPVLDLDISFTDETVAANVKDAKANNSQLSLVAKAPWVLGLLGLLAGAGGAFLLLAGRRDDVSETPSTDGRRARVNG
jgi:Porin PorA